MQLKRVSPNNFNLAVHLQNSLCLQHCLSSSLWDPDANSSAVKAELLFVNQSFGDFLKLFTGHFTEGRTASFKDFSVGSVKQSKIREYIYSKFQPDSLYQFSNDWFRF